MIGAFLTHQQPLQQIISIYYIFQDIILLSQYFYYTKVYPTRRSECSTDFAFFATSRQL